MRMSDLSSDVCSSDLVVNERDMLGSDLVPDYLTDVDEGDFFGWPWYYWGGFIDPRFAPEAEDRRQYVKRPAYGLGDRKSVGEGKSVSVLVDLGGRRIYKTKKRKKNNVDLNIYI